MEESQPDLPTPYSTLSTLRIRPSSTGSDRPEPRSDRTGPDPAVGTEASAPRAQTG